MLALKLYELNLYAMTLPWAEERIKILGELPRTKTAESAKVASKLRETWLLSGEILNPK